MPSWAGEPDLATGRVYIYQGQVHLIPVCDDPGHVTPLPRVTPAPHVCAGVVTRYPHLTRAHDRVQAVIRDKLGAMPRDTRDNHHVTNVTIPRSVAKMLSQDVKYLSQIVTALNERDPIDMRKARTMTRVKPEHVSKYRVKFSKCLYAMLSSSNVAPARASGWDKHLDQSGTLGFKLSLGLEILLTRARIGSGNSESNMGNSKQWLEFKNRLKNNGFFKNELEGSRKYRELENIALKFFLESNKDDGEEPEYVNDVFQEVVKTKDTTLIDCDVVGPLVDVVGGEDWMEMTPDILDAMLEAQFGVSKDANKQNIPEEVNKFLNRVSDMAGVEHDKGGDINFDPDNLLKSMEKLLTGDIDSGNKNFPEELDSDTSDDDVDQDISVSDPIMMDYMSKLDKEIPKDDIDKPLDIDQNVLSNLLQSYSEELGHGPVSSLFQSMKVNPGRKD